MTDETPGTGTDAGSGLTEAEKLTALDSYIKILKVHAEELRERVTREMGRQRTERVGAYLPDGTKLGAVGYNPGNVTAKVTDVGAALRWCRSRYPEEVVEIVNPAFLKALTEYAKRAGRVGDKGVDPMTRERLDFIEVTQGDPYVRVTTTEEGIERMTALAGSFAGMLEAEAVREVRAGFDRLDRG